MNVAEVLTMLADVVDSVQRAVQDLEAGDRSSGMVGLEDCIVRVGCTLGSLPEGDESDSSAVLDSADMREELEAVLEDLRAARDILLTASPGQQGS